MVQSDTILGRRLNAEFFERGGTFRVSAYRTRWGAMRYSDPVTGRAKSSVSYRVIVRSRAFEPKREARRSGFWIGLYRENWVQYEGPSPCGTGTISAYYFAPPRGADGKPDLSTCRCEVRVWRGVL